jgi:protein-S-isoprenylcysteine O-methyltransferase Ste14
MKTLFIAVRSLVFMTLFLWLWVWIARGARRWGDALLPAWTAAAGIALLALGGALALACVATFVVRGRGTPAPFDAPRVFVAAGAYRYVRNPMYIGGVMMLAGFGLVERSLAILIFCLPWFCLAHLFVVLYEEPTLRGKFGAPYEEYCRLVHRWIPVVRYSERL